MEVTLDKKWIIRVIRWELNPINLNLDLTFFMNIYVYIYMTRVATSCDLDSPRCTTEVLRVRLHGSRGGVFVGHRSPRDPGDPRNILYEKEA